MNRQKLIKLLGAFGALAAAAALALDGKLTEAGGVLTAALSSSAVFDSEDRP